MNTYYFNNTIWCFNKEIVIITENAFRKIVDNLLCGTPSGSWNNHWLNIEAKNLTEARKHIETTWCNR